eukprot:s1306_g18.t1
MVTLMAQLLSGTMSNHRQFENELNDDMVFAGTSLDETCGKRLCSSGGYGESPALVIFNDAEDFIHVSGRSWLGTCREPSDKALWIGPATRWTSYMRLKGLIFLLKYTQTAAMDAAQAQDLLGRIMNLSAAATTAATTADQMLEAFNPVVARSVKPDLEMEPNC